MHINNLFKGSKVKLTSVKDKDIGLIEEWYNDGLFLRFYDMAAAFPKNSSQISEMLKATWQAQDRCIFAVRTVEDSKLIGVTGFENILWNNGNATIYIGIGDSECRGKGYGFEALNLTIQFGFQELNLHRIQLNVLSYNEQAIKLYEKVGFKREGTYREFIFRDGKRQDMYLYGLLRREWNVK
ncbi:MAG: GNAT family protein [Bacillota bacterium]|nr:GNAT family protein [Bacillota bacterium]